MLENTCEKIGKCPFFMKYSALNPEAMESFKKTYCEGPLLHICIRKTYYDKLKVPPSDDLGPDGDTYKTDN